MHLTIEDYECLKQPLIIIFLNHKEPSRGVGTFSKVGAKIQDHNKMHAHVVQSTHAGMQSMPNLGGLGARKFCKFTLSEIESESIFNDLHTTLH